MRRTVAVRVAKTPALAELSSLQLIGWPGRGSDLVGDGHARLAAFGAHPHVPLLTSVPRLAADVLATGHAVQRRQAAVQTTNAAQGHEEAPSSRTVASAVSVKDQQMVRAVAGRFPPAAWSLPSVHAAGMQHHVLAESAKREPQL
jgi:hypothetical protein